MIPTHVLVPLDGSLLSDEALTYALETFDCRITVLNVVAPLDTGMSEGGLLEPGADRRAAADERAANLVDRASQQVSEPWSVPAGDGRERRDRGAVDETGTDRFRGAPALGQCAQRGGDADHERGAQRRTGVRADGRCERR
jgi:hypothetical protein